MGSHPPVMPLLVVAAGLSALVAPAGCEQEEEPPGVVVVSVAPVSGAADEETPLTITLARELPRGSCEVRVDLSPSVEPSAPTPGDPDAGGEADAHPEPVPLPPPRCEVPARLLTVVPPGLEPGVYDLRVQVAGVGTATLPDAFTVLPPPSPPEDRTPPEVDLGVSLASGEPGWARPGSVLRFQVRAVDGGGSVLRVGVSHHPVGPDDHRFDFSEERDIPEPGPEVEVLLDATLPETLEWGDLLYFDAWAEDAAGNVGMAMPVSVVVWDEAVAADAGWEIP